MRLRNFGINAHASFTLDFRRRADATVTEAMQNQDENQTEDESAAHARKGDELAVWLRRPFMNVSRVHNAHVTNFAGTHHSELLNVIQNRSVQLVVYFDILLQF